MVSEFTLQLFLRNSYLLSFVEILKNIHNYLERQLSLLPFPARYLFEAEFSSYAPTKTAYQYRLNAKAEMKILLSSIILDIKEFCKSKTTALLVLHFISFQKIYFLS